VNGKRETINAFKCLLSELPQVGVKVGALASPASANDADLQLLGVDRFKQVVARLATRLIDRSFNLIPISQFEIIANGEDNQQKGAS